MPSTKAPSMLTESPGGIDLLQAVFMRAVGVKLGAAKAFSGLRTARSNVSLYPHCLGPQMTPEEA